MRFHNFVQTYSKLTKVPKYYHFLIIFPSILRRGFKLFIKFIYFVRVNKESLCESYSQSLNKRYLYPIIELLIVTTKKDFHNLNLCIKSAINNSINPISGITLVLPEKDFIYLKKINLENFGIKLRIMFDESLIPSELKKDLLKIPEFNRGWILQQFLKMNFASESNSQGLLIVDSDTILCKPRIWLVQNKEQLLVRANTIHQPYLAKLNNLGFPRIRKANSYVTHHMLIQPQILRCITENLGYGNYKELFKSALASSEKKTYADFSLDYEYYGQGLVMFFPHLVHFGRFANLSLNKSQIEIIDFELIKTEYYSYSLHSWHTSDVK